MEWAASVTAIKSARIGIAGTAHSAVGIQPATFRDVLGVRVLAGHLDALAQDTASGDAATGENLTRDAAAGESPTRDTSAGESPTRDATAGASPTRDTSAGETAIADRSAGDARVALGADLAAELGIGVGDRVPVTFAGSGEAAGETPAGVVAIFDPDSLVLAAPALVSYDRLAAAAPHAGDTGAFVAVADGVTVDRARPALRAALADFPTAQLLDADAVTARVQSGANRLLGLVFGLLFLSIVITLFGITNTLGLSVLERTRELGLLRGVGMTRVQTRAMVRWESVIVAVLGGLLGLAVGGLFGWVAVRALPAEFEAFAFPAGRLLAAAAVAVLAGVLAAVIPARRASRIDVLRAVTVE